MTWPERPRVLLSYAFINANTVLPKGVDTLIDSGAFTAHTKGKQINLDEYMAWLDRHRNEYRAAFALDVIGDPEASLRNYRIMRRELDDRISLIPTWHVGSDWSAYTTLLQAGAPLVAIGGAVAHSNRQNALMRTFVAAHREARRAGVNLHGLGQTSWHAMRLPWESVDSSSWAYPRQYPMILLAHRNGRVRSITRGKPQSVGDATLARRYGLNPGVIANPQATKRRRDLVDDYTIQTARSYIYTEAVSHYGTRVHLATSAADTPMVTEAWALGSPWSAVRSGAGI